jgi:hypothetical protein
MPASVILRPEEPVMNRPSRKAGIGIAERWSAEGAAPEILRAPRLRRSIFHPELDPGLTAGPMNWRPFGPQVLLFRDTRRACRAPEMISRLRHYLRRSV